MRWALTTGVLGHPSQTSPRNESHWSCRRASEEHRPCIHGYHLSLSTVVVALNAQLLRRIDFHPETLTARLDDRSLVARVDELSTAH